MNVALLPAKALPLAKTRLAPLLTDADRAAVSRAMFQDVLTALRGASCLDAIVVVTSDPVLAADARHQGVIVCAEDSPRGLNGAVALGTSVAVALGATTVAVVLSDIPLLRSADVAQMCASAPARGALVVPSKEGTFTNALLRRPPTIFPSTFGRRSLARHVAAAERRGLACAILRNDRVAFDVDTPDDLRAFAAAESGTATYREAARLGLAALQPVA